MITLKRIGLCIAATLTVLAAVGVNWLPHDSTAQAQVSPVPTPTPTRSNVIINEITAPREGDAVAGYVDMRGTALIDNYRRYDIHLALSGSESWQWLTTSFEIVRDGILYRLDTTEFEDGFVDLRVRAIADGGNYTETFVRNLEIRNANPPTPTPQLNELGTPQPSSPLLTPTATATPAPTMESRVPGGAGFYGPESGDLLKGYVPIRGTVNGSIRNPFDRYELFISPAGLEDWSWLHTGIEQIWQNDIYLLDTYRLPDGLYDLRLRVVYRDSNYDDFHLRRLYIANHSEELLPSSADTAEGSRALQTNGFTYPESGERVGGVIHFRGTAMDPNFRRWEISWSPAGEETWAHLVNSDQPVVGDLLARLDLTLLPAGSYDFRLRVVRSDGNYTEHFLRGLTVEPPTPAPEATSIPTPTAAG
jgi:hypothetical protein